MLKQGEALGLAKAFCRAYLEQRDPSAVLELAGENVVFIGTSAHERIFGRMALMEYLCQDMKENPEPFRVRFLETRESPLGPEIAAADLILEMCNDTFQMKLQMSAVALSGPDGTLLRHVHYAVSTSAQEEGEHYPLALVQRRIDAMKSELMERSTAGGIMGGYIEQGFPFYCINGQMLRYLGYDSEEEFVRDNDGLISRCMHPDDRAAVDEKVDCQLAAGSEYSVEYRMRKKDGSCIWVHDVGRAITAEDGRPAIISVCLDITGLKETERQLEESRRRYQLAVEGADICVWEYDIQNRRVYQSESAPEYPGFGPVVEDVPESIIRAGRVREDCVESVREMYRRLREGAAHVSGEFWLCGPGRMAYRCERVTYVAVPTPDGTPARAYGASQDITRRKEAERRYEEEIRYRERVEATMLSSCRVDLTAEMVEEQYYEGHILRNVPYDEAFRKKSNHRILEPEMAATLYAEMMSARLIERFYQGENGLRWEYHIQRKEGRRCRVQTTVNLMRRPDTGDVLAFFYTKDVTREWLLESTVDTIISTEYDFITHIDLRTGLYSIVSGRTGVAPVPEVGSYGRMLEELSSRLSAEGTARVREALDLSRVEAEIKKAAVYTFEYELPDREGDLRRKKLRFTCVDRQAGDVILTQADIEDIVQTEKAKQDALRAALRAARDANQAKSNFMARMSHDMRTPMNGVIGLSKLGLDVETLEEARDYFVKISRSGEYLMLLVNDTLEMNRIESGHLELHPEPHSSQKLFEEVAAINRFAAEEKGITFITECTQAAQRNILADRERTMQVFNNLLSNAIKFTPRGGRVEFFCDCGGETEDGLCRIRVVVRDTGIGIGKEFLPRLFDPFEQENDSTLGEENMGSGLGLSIVKCLVDLMGGQITATSEKGAGTAFEVLLNFQQVELPKEAALPSGGEAALSGCRVLLCEDHPLNAQITAKMLEKQGVLVDHAENGQIGLDRFAASHPGYYDAILMDVRMPVLDGLETTRCIRALPREDARTVPVLAMTANAFREDREKSREAGMDDHLSKPVAPQELYAALRKWIFK